MNTEFKRLIEKYNLEQLVELKVLLDKELLDRVKNLNEVLGLNNPIETFVKISKDTNDNVAKDTKDNIKENTKEETNKDTKEEKKITYKPWNTEDMPKVCKFNKRNKKYHYFKTEKEGLLTAITCNINDSLLGGQVAHNGRIYNYVYSSKYELPVVFGRVTKEYLAEIKEAILNNLPEDFTITKPLGKRYKSDYGYKGRFYYDELEEGKFIYKTKDGYKGYTDGITFKVISHEDTTTHEEVIDNMNVLMAGYYFSQNYENAFSDRQRRIYPNLTEDIKDLITKVNNRFDEFDYDDEEELEEKVKETKAISKNTSDDSNKGGLLDGLTDEVEEDTVEEEGGLLDGLTDEADEQEELEEEVVDAEELAKELADDVCYQLAAKHARRAFWN